MRKGIGTRWFQQALNPRAIRSLRGIPWKTFRFLILFGLSIVVLFPLFYSLSVAFRSPDDLFDPLVIYVPRHFTLDNLKDAVTYLDYFTALKNSVILDLISTLIQVASCALVGYGLARYHFRLRGLVFALVIITIIVPPQTIIIPNYLNFRYFDLFGFFRLFEGVGDFPGYFNLINNNLSFYLLALFGMGIRSGLFIFLFRQFFRSMPKDLEEAAAIDGCGQFRTFIRIMVPNASSAFLTTFLFSLVWYWNDFVYTSTYMSNAETVLYQLYLLSQQIDYIMEYEKQTNPYEGILILQAGVLLGILPLLAVYIVLQKYFTESIERSGIVG